MDPKGDEYISLREAARLSGYSSDYIGQLIRSGKLPGKQVFSNVSWVTTEDAVRSYLAKDAKKIESAKQALIAEQISSPELVARIYFWVSWVIIGLLGCFVLFLAYVLAVSIDHRIEQSSMEHAPYVE
jgi:hypothetical protein